MAPRLGRDEAGAPPGGVAGAGGSGARGQEPELAAAAQAILARAGSENFPVALRFLPREPRRHLMAIYGYARLVDFIGDELEGDRVAALDAIEADLDRAFAGSAEHPLLQQLTPTLRARALPREPFARLLEANRRDQRVTRYATQADLFDYCRDSADPVGRLVLYVFGAATPERVAFSDSICTALQLAEHCQDVAEDFAAGRVYLPGELLDACGAGLADLAAATASPALREAVRREAEVARGLLRSGEPLLATLRGAARLAVAGFTAGGYAALDGLARADYDVLGRRPRVHRRDFAMRFAGCLVRAARGSR